MIEAVGILVALWHAVVVIGAIIVLLIAMCGFLAFMLLMDDAEERALHSSRYRRPR